MRQLSAQLLIHLPISSKCFGPPSLLPSKRLAEMNELIVTELESPSYFHATTSPPAPSYPIEESYHGKALVRVAQGRVFSHEGVIITQGDYAIEETCEKYGAAATAHRVFKRNYLGSCRHIPGRVGVALGYGERCYFHWIFDFLPKLLILKEMEPQIDTYLLPNIDLPFQKETLKLIGVDEEKILSMQREDHISADELIYPQIDLGMHLRPRSSLFAARDLIMRAAEKIELKRPLPRRVYISRERASTRRIINEKALMQTLTTIGFEKVFLEDYSLLEQARLFQNADMILAPHGSGLTNLIFAKPRTSVLEIHQPDLISPHYHLLSDLLELNYAAHFAQPLESGDEKLDMIVDVEEIYAACERLISEQSK